jgi:hypothetical protein
MNCKHSPRVEEMVETNRHIKDCMHQTQTHSHAEVEEALQTYNLIHDEDRVERRWRFISTHRAQSMNTISCGVAVAAARCCGINVMCSYPLQLLCEAIR